MRLGVSLCVLLALVVAFPLASPAQEPCGVWRWSVKTLSDPAAYQVNFAPVARTVSQLRQLQAPDELGKNTPRLSPREFIVYRVRARLIEYKRQSDRDFHVVIASSTNRKLRMVAEIVDPTCPGAKDSPRVDALKAVRQEFIQQYGQPTTSFKPVPGQPIAILVGVALWDLCTDAHKPRGAAPNCIELHPVLDIEPVP